MRIHAILNRNAGAIIGTGPEVFERRLVETFTNAGHEISIEAVEAKQIGARFREAADEGYDALIVGGGDGSVNAAAAALLGHRTALGILPLGTVNRLARDLDLTADVGVALQLLAEAEPRKIDVGEVNGRIFLCNSFIGLPPLVTERRRSFTAGHLPSGSEAMQPCPWKSRGCARRLAIVVDDEAMARAHRALTVVVSNNVYSEGPHLIPKRRALDEGRLGSMSPSTGPLWQTVWLLLRAALGLWKGDPDLDARELKRVTIRSNSKRLKVVNDGELMWLSTPLRYHSGPKRSPCSCRNGPRHDARCPTRRSAFRLSPATAR